MAERWYPVIDYTLCTECGSCIRKCSHGVYDINRAPLPVVRVPLNCVDHCHGCGNLCPSGAITYVGDDTGWQPLNKAGDTSDSCCNGNCSCETTDTLKVEYLYLDLETCDRCVGTDKVLDDVMETLTPALELSGFKVEYRKILIDGIETARKHKFLSSPTIRINGKDIFGDIAENSCGCCSDISGYDVDCRVFIHEGREYEIPSAEMIAREILEMVFGEAGDECNCGEYSLPDNLARFFNGKNDKECSCGGNCC